MKVAIIGSGYVGSAFAQFMRKAGHEITVTTKQPERINELKFIADHVFQLPKVVTSETFKKLLSKQEVLLVSVAPSKEATYKDTYLKTATLLLEGLNNSPSLKQILYTSSTSVYGDHQGNKVDELTRPKPSDENGRILLETEQTLLAAMALGCKVMILRLGGIFGPERTLEKQAQHFSGRRLAGTGESFTNLIHLQDIINALDFGLKNQLSGIYNLCNDLHIPRKVFYSDLCSRLGIPLPNWDPSSPSPHAGNKIVCNEKIKQLGFTFTNPN